MNDELRRAPSLPPQSFHSNCAFGIQFVIHHSSFMKIGVLAVQGDYAAHARMLKRIGVEAVELRRADELDGVDALIIPGGESTTMLKFVEEEVLGDAIKSFAASARPIFATCAGAILVAREVSNPP